MSRDTRKMCRPLGERFPSVAINPMAYARSGRHVRLLSSPRGFSPTDTPARLAEVIPPVCSVVQLAVYGGQWKELKSSEAILMLPEL